MQDIEDMEQLIVYQSWFDYINHIIDTLEPYTAIIVYSPTTLLKSIGVSEYHRENVTCLSSHIDFDDLEDWLSEKSDKYKVCIGIGGGTAIDKAKYLAKNLGLECIAIPSMLSTDVFATDKITYIAKDRSKSTITGVLPDVIVYDEKLIRLSDKYSIYGLADALSSLTALRDWELSDEAGVEVINSECYVESALMLAKGKKIIREGVFKNEDIFEVLLEAGYVTNKYGSGRPESGSEHVIAKAVEKRYSLPHAVAVSFGLLIISQFYNCFDEVVDLIKRIGIFKEVLSIPYNVLKTALIELKPREDRYTIIDTLSKEDLSPSKVEKYLRRMYKAFGIAEGAIIFDLDGVLWNSVDEIQTVYQKALNISKDELQSVMGKDFNQISTELGIEPELLSSIQEYEVAHLMNNPGKIYPGVIMVLKLLRDSGRMLFIVSNCQKGYINAFLENYGLSEFFTEWRYADKTKENPKAANLSCLKAKYHLFRSLYIGDTQGDYDSAKLAGIDFIAADYGFGEILGDRIISRINSIEGLILALEE